MPHKSPYQADAVLGTANGVAMAAWVAHVGLWVGDPFAGGVEVTYAGYARRPASFGATLDASPTGRQASNILEIVFATTPASGALVAITHAVTLDALVGGNIRYSQPYAATFANGQEPYIPVGALVLVER